MMQKSTIFEGAFLGLNACMIWAEVLMYVSHWLGKSLGVGAGLPISVVYERLLALSAEDPGKKRRVNFEVPGRFTFPLIQTLGCSFEGILDEGGGRILPSFLGCIIRTIK